MYKINGTRLRALRIAYPLSMRELAAAARVSLTTVADLEANRKLARASTVRKLAEALGVETRELLSE